MEILTNRDVQHSPTVSVILSVFNGERYLQEAIDSILDQTFKDFEFIIVNDGSTDASTSILKCYDDPRIIHVSNSTNQGLIASLNKGLSRASGQFIARQDADDISFPNRLEEQVKTFNESPQLVLVGSNYHHIDKTGRQIRLRSTPLNDTEIRWHLLFENPFAHGSVMMRANILHRHGLLYNKDILHAEDFDLWSRLLHYGMGKNIEQPLVKIRCHDERISMVYASEQMATADRIVWANLQQLGVSLSTPEVRTLRSWRRKPQLVTAQDIRNGRCLLEILRKFGKQEIIEPRQFRIIRYRYMNKILKLMSLKDLVTFQKIRFFGVLLRDHRILVLKHLIKRSIRLGR